MKTQWSTLLQKNHLCFGGMESHLIQLSELKTVVCSLLLSFMFCLRGGTDTLCWFSVSEFGGAAAP